MVEKNSTGLCGMIQVSSSFWRGSMWKLVSLGLMFDFISAGAVSAAERIQIVCFRTAAVADQSGSYPKRDSVVILTQLDVASHTADEMLVSAKGELRVTNYIDFSFRIYPNARFPDALSEDNLARYAQGLINSDEQYLSANAVGKRHSRIYKFVESSVPADQRGDYNLVTLDTSNPNRTSYFFKDDGGALSCFDPFKIN